MNTYAIISVMLVCRFVYAKTLLDFERLLEKIRYRKTIVMDILHPATLLKSDSNIGVFHKTYANR